MMQQILMTESKSFDPYHQWLGIPKSEQPPNLYRLLGLGMFEEDADVIDTAADRAMSFLQQCATGEHVVESQQLLNEVSQARLRLLNPKQKAAYDQDLKKNLYKDLVEPDPMPQIELEPARTKSRVPQRKKKSGGRSRGSRSNRKRRDPLPLKIGVAFVGLVAFGLVVWGMLPRDDSTDSPDQAGKTVAKSKTDSKQVVAKAEQKPAVKTKRPGGRNGQKPVRPRQPVIGPNQPNVVVEPPPPGVDLNRGLVGFYPFERQPHPLHDVSGNGFDGRAVGGAGFTGGRFGQGLAVSQTHEYHFQQTGKFEFDQPFSFSIWCRSNSTGLVISRQQPTPGQRGYSLGLQDGDLVFSLVSDATTGNMIRATAKIDQGDRPQFHLLTVTYDGSGESEGIGLFFNGQKLPQESVENKITAPIGSDQHIFRIGKHDKRPGVFGIVDDLLVYDRQLKDAEIEYLSRGGRPVAKLGGNVAQQPNGKPVDIPANAEANRKAALWVINHSGSVRILKPGEKRPSNMISKAEQLPDEQFQVVYVNLTNPKSTLDREGLELLAELPKLEELLLDRKKLQDEHCEILAGCRSLKVLAIPHTQVSDVGLAALAPVTTLDRLHLAGCNAIDGSAFEKLHTLQTLQTLDLNQTGTTDSALKHIARFPILRSLSLSDTKVTDAGLQEIAPLTKLMTLTLDGTAVTDEGVGRLDRMTELRTLSLSRTTVSDVSIRVISNMQLVYLHLSDTRVTGASMPLLSACPNLNQVDLNGLPIEDSQLAILSQLPNLFRLNMDRSKVTDTGIQSFSKTPRLVYLSVKQTGVTVDGANRLKQQKPNIRVYVGD